jgi:exodeoxyribonuclease III
MRIVSWNINSLRKRQDRLFAWLEATKPDIVCLQETKCPDELFPALGLQAAGYRSAYHGEKSYNGVAILAKTEPHDIRPSLCDEVIDPQARVIAASIGALRVFSIYAPNGQAVGSPAYEYKLRWYRRLRDCIGKEKFEPVVVCGDFNVAPEDIDVYDPNLWRGAIMCSDGERAALRELCKIGLRDTLRIHHQKASYLAGGTIRCARSKKIAACALMQFWRMKSWQKNASHRGLIAKCAKAKNLPITRRYGRSFAFSEK